jgi:predicted regulator of amino acid metabolism with ACT domain
MIKKENLSTNELYNTLKDWHEKKEIVILYRNGIIPVHIIDYLTYFEFWKKIKNRRYAVTDTAVEFGIARKTVYNAINTFLSKKK